MASDFEDRDDYPAMDLPPAFIERAEAVGIDPILLALFLMECITEATTRHRTDPTPSCTLRYPKQNRLRTLPR